MELLEAMRTTGAVREFTADPVPDDVLWRVLDAARFAPSGGNRQAWHVVVVRDPTRRLALREHYRTGWYDYLAMTAAGLRPWSPANDRDREARALQEAPRIRAEADAAPPGFAERLDEVPVLLALLVDLAELAAVDRDFERYPFAGGASVYPFAQNLLLAAREEGLGGVITTMAIRSERAVLEVLGAPDGWALAALIALGHPRQPTRRLRRATVADFTTIDSVDGPPLEAPAESDR